MKQGPHLLIILDGFGYQHTPDYNALYHANPRHLLSWMDTYPSSLLHASGRFVGLLPHMMGNSEVGHLTLGSGRVIKQPLLELHDQIASGSFFSNRLLIEHFNRIKKKGKRLHLMGLLSDAGVHSHIDHLLALITLAHRQGVESVVVHPFLDGRDTPPQSAAHYLRILEDALSVIPVGVIGTLHGRFYAMDRDKHWERTERSYKILTSPQKSQATHWQEALSRSYDLSITDEFFVPLTLREDAAWAEGDLLIFFNFRADRARQLTQALLQPSTVPFSIGGIALPTHMITCTSYSPDFKVEVLIHKNVIYNTFFDVLE
nr:2,3-bisphosphoglycerate-independent phosphoglycerate mutase [Candidatus Dependentiae bacterium]